MPEHAVPIGAKESGRHIPDIDEPIEEDESSARDPPVAVEFREPGFGSATADPDTTTTVEEQGSAVQAETERDPSPSG
jgi:hypothetical protein